MTVAEIWARQQFVWDEAVEYWPREYYDLFHKVTTISAYLQGNHSDRHRQEIGNLTFERAAMQTATPKMCRALFALENTVLCPNW